MDGSIHDGLIFLIKQDSDSLIFYLWFWIPFFCYGLFYFLDGFSDWGFFKGKEKFGPKGKAYFGIFIMLICAPNCFISICDILHPKVVFACHDDGFYLKNNKPFVRWSDVSTVKMSHYRRSRYRRSRKTILLKFSNEDLIVKSLPMFDKLMYSLRKINYDGYGFLINLKYTDRSISAKDIFQIFEKKCPKAVFIK